MGEEIEVCPGPTGAAAGRAEALTTKDDLIVSGGSGSGKISAPGPAAIGTSLDPALAKGELAHGTAGRNRRNPSSR